MSVLTNAGRCAEPVAAVLKGNFAGDVFPTQETPLDLDSAGQQQLGMLSIFSLKHISWICLEDKLITPCRGKTFLLRSSQQLLSVSFLILEGLYELIWSPSRACLLLELQRYKDTMSQP